jgi:hypothetical protein
MYQMELSMNLIILVCVYSNQIAFRVFYSFFLNILASLSIVETSFTLLSLIARIPFLYFKI